MNKEGEMGEAGGWNNREKGWNRAEEESRVAFSFDLLSLTPLNHRGRSIQSRKSSEQDTKAAKTNGAAEPYSGAFTKS